VRHDGWVSRQNRDRLRPLSVEWYGVLLVEQNQDKESKIHAGLERKPSQKVFFLYNKPHGVRSCQASMPRNNLGWAQKIVKTYCQEHDIAYYETSDLQSFREILQFLHEVSAPLREKKVVVNKPGVRIRILLGKLL